MQNPDTTNPGHPDINSTTPAPPPAAETPPPSRHRRGHIARLPKKIREHVNTMLDDGTPFSRIVEYLEQKGHHISEGSVSSWKTGGYQDWLREQRYLEESRLRHELTLRFASQDEGITTFQAAHKLAVAMICGE